MPLEDINIILDSLQRGTLGATSLRFFKEVLPDRLAELDDIDRQAVIDRLSALPDFQDVDFGRITMPKLAPRLTDEPVSPFTTPSRTVPSDINQWMQMPTQGLQELGLQPNQNTWEDFAQLSPGQPGGGSTSWDQSVPYGTNFLRPDLRGERPVRTQPEPEPQYNDFGVGRPTQAQMAELYPAAPIDPEMIEAGVVPANLNRPLGMSPALQRDAAWYQHNVVEPTAGAVVTGAESLLTPFSEGEWERKARLAENMRRNQEIIDRAEAEKAGLPVPESESALGRRWQAAGEAWRETPLPSVKVGPVSIGLKGGIEMFVDAANLLPGGYIDDVYRGLAKLGPKGMAILDKVGPDILEAAQDVAISGKPTLRPRMGITPGELPKIGTSVSEGLSKTKVSPPISNQIEDQIRASYTPEKANGMRNALTKMMSGAYDQTIVREGSESVENAIRALEHAGVDASRFNLPLTGKLATRKQFSQLVEEANVYFRALNKVEDELYPSVSLPKSIVPSIEAPVRPLTPGELPKEPASGQTAKDIDKAFAGMGKGLRESIDKKFFDWVEQPEQSAKRIMAKASTDPTYLYEMKQEGDKFFIRRRSIKTDKFTTWKENVPVERADIAVWEDANGLHAAKRTHGVVDTGITRQDVTRLDDIEMSSIQKSRWKDSLNMSDAERYKVQTQIERELVSSVNATTPPLAPAGGRVIEPPRRPPTTGTVPTPSGRPSGIQRMITQAENEVAIIEPGKLSDLAQKVPLLKQARAYDRPALNMVGENKKVWVAGVAESDAANYVRTQANATRESLFDQIESAFGKGSLKKDAHVNVPIVNGQYVLNPEQIAAAKAIQNRNNILLDMVNSDYGSEIGKFEPKPGPIVDQSHPLTGTLRDVLEHNGVYLPDPDISLESILMVGNERRVITSGRSKERFYNTARERMAADPTFAPETNVRKLIEGLDESKANIAAGQTYKAAIGGKTKLEVLKETHPELYAKMTGLQKQLQSLRGSAGTLDTNLQKAIDDFLVSPLEDIDLTTLQADLNMRLKTGKRAGMNVAAIDTQIQAVKAQIAELRPAWKMANTKPYVFVQDGIFRYFPVEQANLIRESRRVSNNPFFKAIEEMRAIRLGADTSVITGIQTPNLILFDPVGTAQTALGGIKAALRGGDWGQLNIFSTNQVNKRIATDPAKYAEYASLRGRSLGTVPTEFAGGGLVQKIPGFTKASQAMYNVVTLIELGSYDRMVANFVKSGMEHGQAVAIAADQLSMLNPSSKASLLGQSSARAGFIRALPSSYSYIRKPIELAESAAVGYFKLGTFQKLTPKEALAVKNVTTMAATAMAIAVTSTAITAKMKGKSDKEVLKAVEDAINPNSANWATIIVGDWRIPMGGPFRSIFKAMWPQKVEGVPFPVPFAGVPSYITNHITPAIRTQIDLMKNKDFYGNTILKGDFVKQLGQFMEYEAESLLPMALGTAMGSVRTAQDFGTAGREALTQFGGMNVKTMTDYQKLKEKRDALAQKVQVPDGKGGFNTGFLWDELGVQAGELYQDILTKEHPELQALEDKYTASAGKTAEGVRKVWLDYNAEGDRIKARTQSNMKAAAAIFKRDKDGYAFKEAVNSAYKIQGSDYLAREQNPQFNTIVVGFNKPLTDEQKKAKYIGDVAFREYRQQLYAPDMENPVTHEYNFDLRDKKITILTAKYGQQVMDYIDDELGQSRKDLPPEVQALKRAQEYLKPYWGITDVVWSAYTPAERKFSDTIKKLEDSDSKADQELARKYLLKSPAIVRARYTIALMKEKYREKDKLADTYYRFYYSQ